MGCFMQYYTAYVINPSGHGWILLTLNSGLEYSSDSFTHHPTYANGPCTQRQNGVAKHCCYITCSDHASQLEKRNTLSAIWQVSTAHVLVCHDVHGRA
jgi:hypothetical protein